MCNEDTLLVKALSEVPVRANGTRVYSVELRRQAVAWYLAKREQGFACRMIGDTLGIHPVLLAAWARREQTQGFRQIELLAGAAPSAQEPGARVEPIMSQRMGTAPPASTPTSGLTLISPRGWRIEGIEKHGAHSVDAVRVTGTTDG